MPVGEIFLSAVMQALFQQLVSSGVMALARERKIASHIDELKQDFHIILAVLDEAEEKQQTEKPVKAWLEGLRDFAYDLDDLLNDLTTTQLHSKTSLVRKIIPACCNFVLGAPLPNYGMLLKIKTVQKKLAFLVKQRTDFNLRDNIEGPSTQSSLMSLTSTSLVVEAQVYGRDVDKKICMELLFSNEACLEKFSVIPIVGPSGIGKTTLAQLLYNDTDVKQRFDVRAWVCVSEKFDVFTITKEIFNAVTGRDGESMTLDLLQVGLREFISKKTSLVVLDNVWDQDYKNWDLLFRPFQFGLPQSRAVIIVTTRNLAVASVVGSPRTAHIVKLLLDDDCLAILAQHSSQSFDNNPELKEVGQKLAKKCKGLPFTAATLGGLLRSKTIAGWKDVLNSKIWDLPEENNILPVSRLSYYNLPSHLKLLFAYCSIFLKDYVFDKNELVLLWMGVGFLETPYGTTSNETKSKEELGHEYFNDLVSRSFFQQLSGSESLFVMHDLIIDLARIVAGGICYRLDEKMDSNQEYRLPERVRHASFPRHEYEVFRKFKAFSDVQGLRTFLPMPVKNSHVRRPFYLSNRILLELVPKLHRLRVLSLSGYTITQLPNRICKLTNLRYLNLSGTLIVTLPDSLGNLYLLETLSLSECRNIRYLPRTLGNLKNLRHLDVSNTDQLKDMPVEIGKLTKLQTLPKIVLSKTGSLGLKEIGNLKLLRGKIAILELHRVTDKDNASDADLRSKNELDELQLVWGSNSNVPRDTSSDEEILDLLEPNENLRKLEIEFYGGVNFASWIGDPLFSKLSTVTLRKCIECTSLPPLGKLPELKELHIGEMPKIECIGIEFSGNRDTLPFLKLEILRFNDMPAWERWSNGDEDALISFPQLHQFAVLKCQNLTDVSPLSFPVLRELDLEECSNVLLDRFRHLNELTRLKVESVSDMHHIPTRLICCLSSSLKVLECRSCQHLQSLWHATVPSEHHLICLRRLIVVDCADLTSLANDWSYLVSLAELVIEKCPRFTSFPDNSMPPMLKHLEILACDTLESLPSEVPNIETLEIKNCPSLETWGMSHFPATLKKFTIKSCNQLGPVTDPMFPEHVKVSLEELSLCEWLNFSNLLQRLSGFSNLVELHLHNCSGLEHFPERGLPPCLRALSVKDCASFKTFPSIMSSMKSIVSLEIMNCPSLQTFPESGLPPKLSSLGIWDSEGFKPLAEWGLHRLTSLTEFSIRGGFGELKVLGDARVFPPSLVKLSIARFQKLQSVSTVLENLTLLRHLTIRECAKLNDLPSDQLLEKLWHLEISECRHLTPRFTKERGGYWSKIFGIPCVEIDGTYIH